MASAAIPWIRENSFATTIRGEETKMSEPEKPSVSEGQKPETELSPAEKLESDNPDRERIPGAQNPDSETVKDEFNPNTE